MKDTMDLLQLLVYTALNGQLSWAGINVPVFDEKKPAGDASNVFVILSTQQESEHPQAVSETFITESSIDIVITHRTEFEVSKKAINNVAGQIMQILVPTPYSNPFGTLDHWQVLNVRRTSSISRNVSVTETDSVLERIVTISAAIVQQNP